MGTRGVFVTLEGPEGSGKSTQASRLADRLRATGLEVTETREPGGTAAGELIRSVLLAPGQGPLQPVTEALLFSAARAELVTQVVRPALDRGHVVLCDRFVDSTTAYQGYARGVSLHWLAELARGATGGLAPDLTLLYDLPVESGLARRRASGGEWNRLDAEGPAFHRDVRDGFLRLAAADPGRWAVIAADGSPDAVADATWSAVRRVLRRCRDDWTDADV